MIKEQQKYRLILDKDWFIGAVESEKMQDTFYQVSKELWRTWRCTK